ncbi:MAG: hypothetical protein ACI4TK_03780 [Agathobacter sp.]
MWLKGEMSDTDFAERHLGHETSIGMMRMFPLIEFLKENYIID